MTGLLQLADTSKDIRGRRAYGVSWVPHEYYRTRRNHLTPGGHRAVQPPSIVYADPVTPAAASLQR